MSIKMNILVKALPEVYREYASCEAFDLKGVKTSMNDNISRIKDTNYYQISGWMINRLRLKGVALSVYSIIYGFTQDGENESSASLQYYCDFCGGVSKPTIIKALKELTEKGFIIRREEIINGVMFVRYKANLQVVKEFYEGSKENLTGVVKEFNQGSKENLPNNKSNNKYPENKEIYITIIDFLNEKAGTSYRASSRSTQEHINARLAEGFTVEDFKTVITKKCAEWKGDQRMEQYLRPVTLFGTKFEAYLNAPLAQRKTFGANGVQVNTVKDDDLDDIL